MTEKKVYENILVELNTVKAPSLHLEDYNYWVNKGINEYANERYNLFQTTQQLTDDLQALNSIVNASISVNQTTGVITVTYSGSYNGTKTALLSNRYGSVALSTVLPDNYLHLLQCGISIQTQLAYKCDPAGYIHTANAKRMTSDIAGGIMDNAFLRPGYRNPYYGIIDDYVNGSKQGSIVLYYAPINDASKFSVTSFSVDYLKKPKVVNLTVEQRDSVIDTSSEMEFPDYVCNEIIKRTVKLILENQQNPRLQTQVPVNQSIK